MAVLAAGADTALYAISALVGVAGALGIAYTVFRSSAEQRLREVDAQIINNQNILLAQVQGQLEEIRKEAADAHKKAEMYRSDLTQRAAVERLQEMVVKEERSRRSEHEEQAALFHSVQEKVDALMMLVKDIVAQLRRGRGELQ